MDYLKSLPDFEEKAKKYFNLEPIEIKPPTPIKDEFSSPSTPIKQQESSFIHSPSPSASSQQLFDESFQDDDLVNTSIDIEFEKQHLQIERDKCQEFIKDSKLKLMIETEKYKTEQNDKAKKFTMEIIRELETGIFKAENAIEDINSKLSTLGKGKRRHGGKIGDSSGLWSDEINKIMDKYKTKGFKGVYSIDELNKIPVNADDKEISFIMNTTPSYDNRSGHWIAIFINHDNVEYYDSFGDEPDKQFKKNIKELLYKISPNKLLQFKINNIKRQNGNSNNCGYFAMKFLQDRYAGKHFKIATGFNIFEDSHRGEKEIKAFKKKLIPFNYI